MGLYQPRHILITGGSGFIGANFINYLLSYDYNVHIINYDALTYAANLGLFTDHPRYRLVKGDIRNENAINALLQQYHIDTIIHFAAESHVDRSISNPDLFIDTNINGTHTLIKSAYKYWKDCFNLNLEKCRFYHISTD